MQVITLLDYLLMPFYLTLIYVIAYRVRNTYYPPGHPWHPYFISGLTCKIFGAIGIGLIYQYYYGGGDTFNYFYHAQIINSSFGESPSKWFNLVMRIPAWYNSEYSEYISQMYWYEAPTEYTVAAIAAFLGIFTFTTYLPTAILFGAISFTGIWALFRTFATKYPKYTKYIAWCTLFIPSTIMWGSGIFKDSICMFSLGWLTYGVFRMLINRDLSPRNIVLTVISVYLVSSIKIYILLAFLPALALWVLFLYTQRIKVPFMRSVVKIGVVVLIVPIFMVVMQKFSADLGKYSLDKVAATSSMTSSYIRAASGDEGSGYDLGATDGSLGGMIKQFPLAVNVSLFRPYIWETRKIMQLLNAVEATMFLWVTIKIIWFIGLRRARAAIAADPTIQFCLIFAVIFAFAVGISSGNFGALSRYRIPCLPFYGLALVLIYYKYEPLEKNILSFKR